jgi:hypothetical protein
VCIFKLDKNSSITKFYPNEIKAYRFSNDKYYKSLNIFLKNGYRWVFAEVLLESEINLYYYWDGHDTKYFINKDSNLLGLINRDICVNYKGEYGTRVYNKLVWITIKAYKDTLISIFKDSKNIQDKVYNTDYNHKSLSKITKEYVDEKYFEKKCITYEKDLNKFKPTLGIYSGIQFSKIEITDSRINSKVIGEDIPMITTFPIGVFYNVPLSFINEQISIQIELKGTKMTYSKFGDLTTKNFLTKIQTTSIGVPILLKYTFLYNKIMPFVSFGKETNLNLNSKVTRNYMDDEYLLRVQSGGWFCEVGVNYKINNMFSVFTNLRFQSYKNIITTDDINSNLSFNETIERKSYAEIYKTYAEALYFGIKF